MENRKFLGLEDIECYRTAFDLSNNVWFIVLNWSYLAQDTVGKQFIRSTDSISANIAEGFGRFSKKDKIKFYRYSMGSIKETIDWLEKARVRKLIKTEEYDSIKQSLDALPKQLNSLIKYTNEKLNF